MRDPNVSYCSMCHKLEVGVEGTICYRCEPIAKMNIALIEIPNECRDELANAMKHHSSMKSSHGECGSQKYTFMSVAMVKAK